MKRTIPTTDSIEELARFWDRHDLTDFAGELEEVSTPIFRRSAESLLVVLTPAEREALRKVAASQGVEEAALIHQWVREKLPKPQRGRARIG